MDAKQLKVQGLRFARTLQSSIRTVISFSPNHPSVEGPLKQSFEMLNLIMKETGGFTFGFVDRQVMLNRLLTNDPNLQRLETEFLKRGVGAVTFEPGLNIALYRRVIALLALPVKEMEAAGGLIGYLHENPLEKARIIPAPKNQKRTQDGDTLLDSDSESFLLSKNLEAGTGSSVLNSFEAMLESAGLGGGGGSFMDSAESPNARELPGLGGSGDGSGSGGSGTGTGNGGYGEDASGGLVSSTRRSGDAGSWGYKSFMDMVGATVERSIVEHGAPDKATAGLVRALQEMRLDTVLANFSPQRRAELQNAPPEVVAAELVQETAFEWAGKQLGKAKSSEAKLEVEEDVVRVLVRSLNATQTADQLANKLAQLITDHGLPKHIQDKIQDELGWTALPLKARQARLLDTNERSATFFRRVLQQVKDLLENGRKTDAGELALHYFKMLDTPASVQIEDLSRAPQLITAVAVARSEFVTPMVLRLGQALVQPELSGFKHFQVARCMGALARGAALYEDFADVLALGTELTKVNQLDPETHQSCCGATLKELLPANAVERLLEISIELRDESWTRLAASLLRWSGSDAIEVAFCKLENEPVAKNRMALLRLISQLSIDAIPIACQRMSSPQWFFVRNACVVLGELKDPDVLAHIAPALRHPDNRVQQAALGVMTKSRLPGQAPWLAAALPFLAANLAEQVYQELTFLRDPEAVPALQAILRPGSEASLDRQRKSAQVLGMTPGQAARDALLQVLGNPALDLSVRRQALAPLQKAAAPEVAEVLQRIVADDADPLAAECRRVLSHSA